MVTSFKQIRAISTPWAINIWTKARPQPHPLPTEKVLFNKRLSILTSRPTNWSHGGKTKKNKKTNRIPHWITAGLNLWNMNIARNTASSFEADFKKPRVFLIMLAILVWASGMRVRINQSGNQCEIRRRFVISACAVPQISLKGPPAKNNEDARSFGKTWVPANPATHPPRQARARKHLLISPQKI